MNSTAINLKNFSFPANRPQHTVHSAANRLVWMKHLQAAAKGVRDGVLGGGTGKISLACGGASKEQFEKYVKVKS